MTGTIHNEHLDHSHVHGEGCGHVAIPHGDHVDYVHDGHAHRAHEQHWDKCPDDVDAGYEGHIELDAETVDEFSRRAGFGVDIIEPPEAVVARMMVDVEREAQLLREPA